MMCASPGTGAPLCSPEELKEARTHDSTEPGAPPSPCPRISFTLHSPNAHITNEDDEQKDEVFGSRESIPSPARKSRFFQRNRLLTDTSVRSAPTILNLDSHKDTVKRGGRGVKNYYRKQSDLLQRYSDDQQAVQQFHRRLSQECDDTFVDEEEPVEDDAKAEEEEGEEVDKKKANLLAKITLALNIVLMAVKTVASVLSGSLSIISSLIDSVVDITGGLVIWLTARAIRKRDPYLYPRGRTRLEPIALIIISVVMAVASIQMIIQSVKAITDGEVEPDVGYWTIGIMMFTIVTKFVLAVVCHFYKSSPSIRVLAQDHRNDCVSNTVALICAFLAQRFWVFLDPIGAILVSVYIAGTWFVTGYGQIVILSGRSAKPEYINRIIKIAIEHDSRVRQIDTVYVYHFGTKFLVEVHIVLDEQMTLREAHDISEPLQRKLEHLSFVERAFVHVDYEISHRPEHEHKVV